ncbi:tRNA (cytosine(34)-C(5))-methyltransferase [Morus notabilis]|uniref:tRNA (Cytosine(34)-C(5))-methyltransferase n=1 Tax=Morus notabilis TaxID=981085 RepID=W9SI64_9ROSA|nr:tRNA (cytosine(34)-C(5))-methyltransferase [Morus notabilis]
MVYSTCSMNPIENEAVVAEILRKCGGSVELLDVSNELPQLVRRPGLKKWKVRDKGVWLASYKDVPKYRRSVVVPSMFPSGRSYSDAARSYSDVTDNSNLITEPEEKHENGGNADLEDAVHSTGNSIPSVDVLEEEVSDFPLERCMRIVPHDQNTGAFFIAVFQKNSPLPAVQEKPNPQKEKRNNEPPEDLPNEVIEYSNGLEASSTDVTDGKSSEAASEVDLIDDKLDEVVLAPDLSVALEENSSEAAQASGAKALDSNKAEPDLSVALEENSSEAAQASGAKALDSNKAGGKRKIHMQGKWKGVDPVVFFRDEAIINSIKTFYGIDESFPLVGHLLSRNLDNNHVKRIYYVSKSVKDVLELNFSVGQQLKIASIGLKMFEAVHAVVTENLLQIREEVAGLRGELGEVWTQMEDVQAALRRMEALLAARPMAREAELGRDGERLDWERRDRAPRGEESPDRDDPGGVDLRREAPICEDRGRERDFQHQRDMGLLEDRNYW